MVFLRNNSDKNFAMNLKTVSVIKSSLVYTEHKTLLITVELTRGFILFVFWICWFSLQKTKISLILGSTCAS